MTREPDDKDAGAEAEDAAASAPAFASSEGAVTAEPDAPTLTDGAASAGDAASDTTEEGDAAAEALADFEEAQDEAKAAAKPKRKLFVLREDPPLPIRVLLAAACVGAILGIWAFATSGATVEARMLSPTILPSPGEVFGAFDHLMERDLGASIAKTMKRIIMGFGLAVLIAIPLAVFAASFRAFNSFLSPIIVFFRNTPIATLVPLTIAWFGIGEQQKILFIFIATFAFVFSDAVAAVTSIPQRYVETAQTVGANRRQIIMKVLFPLALPNITTSVRFLFGLGFGYIILAEMVGQEGGLGSLILSSQRRGYIADMYLTLIVIVIIAFAIDRLLHFFQRGIFPYRKDL